MERGSKEKGRDGEHPDFHFPVRLAAGETGRKIFFFLSFLSASVTQAPSSPGPAGVLPGPFTLPRIDCVVFCDWPYFSLTLFAPYCSCGVIKA